MTASVILFSGSALPFGGLSNERELVNACPEEFRKGNRWTDIAAHFVYGDKKPALRWKTADEAERKKQWNCFIGLLGTFELSHEDKLAVAGWMLSEIAAESSAN